MLKIQNPIQKTAIKAYIIVLKREKNQNQLAEMFLQGEMTIRMSMAMNNIKTSTMKVTQSKMKIILHKVDRTVITRMVGAQVENMETVMVQVMGKVMKNHPTIQKILQKTEEMACQLIMT